MNLSNEQIAFIRDAVKTAQLIECDTLRYLDGMFSVFNDSKTAMLCQVPPIEMPFKEIGLIRTPLLLQRIDAFQSRENFNVKCELTAAQTIKSLKFSSKGARAEFTVGNARAISGLKGVADTMLYELKLEDEDVSSIVSAAKIMPASTDDTNSGIISFIGTNEQVTFQVNDSKNDTFIGELTNKAVPLTDNTEVSFCRRYPIKMLLKLLKQSDNVLRFGQKGLLHLTVNGISVYVMQKT